MPFVLALAGVDDRVAAARRSPPARRGYPAARRDGALRPPNPRPRPRGRPDRLRRLAPPAAAQRRHPAAVRRGARAGARVGAPSVLDAVLGLLLLRARRRRADPRPRGVRDRRPVLPHAARRMFQNGRIERKLSATLEGIAWEEFRAAGLPERFRDRIAVVIPAYNEEDNIGSVLPRIPESVCGVGTAVLVVDDGSRDRTGDVAREHGAAVARHVTNLGGGAALRTGYRLMSDSGATGRRHARRRRPAPARGDVAARAAGARRRGRRRPRLARARPRRGQPLRARDGDHLLQPAGLLHHAHEGDRLLQRLPRGARDACSPRSSCARSSSTPPSS